MRNEIAEFALGVPSNRLRDHLTRCRRRLRHEGEPLPRTSAVLHGGEAARPAGALDRDADRELPQPTAMRATMSRPPNWRWPRMATFLGLRVRTLCNMGAYLAWQGPVSSTNNVGGLAGVYRTPHICTEVTGLFTNTQPTAPYRGAGRPEAIYAMERLVDLAADQIGYGPRGDPPPAT